MTSDAKLNEELEQRYQRTGNEVFRHSACPGWRKRPNDSKWAVQCPSRRTPAPLRGEANFEPPPTLVRFPTVLVVRPVFEKRRNVVQHLRVCRGVHCAPPFGLLG
jgi:hypothetical protein